MGLWQHLAESYEKNADTLKKRYPLSTTSISNNGDMIAIVLIDDNGKFLGSDRIEKANHKKGIDTKIISIPVSEKSLGRSSKVSPHPVFDQYEYLKGEGAKYDDYIEQLKEFAGSNFATKQIMAICKYVEKRTVCDDLAGMKLKDKTNIIFQVEIPGHSQAKVWEDETFFNAWHNYCLSVKEATQSLDYITGTDQPTASSHPKKVSNASVHSKLVSDNDQTNYTFRGKFRKSSEAVSIGYDSTQKAHQFLRYLINDRGCFCGTQVILSFTIGSMEKLPPPPITEKSIHEFLQESQEKTERDRQINLRAETGIDYADALRKSLNGFGHSKILEQHTQTAVVALDAATTGRLSITFYRELERNEYLEKVAEWHSGCKWHQKFWDKENGKYVSFIGAPSADKIIEVVHGTPRGGKDESYVKIKKTARERLLRCIFDGSFLPTDYVKAAVRRASNPLGITKAGKFDRKSFEHVVSTACALVRKYYQQYNEEEYKLNVELNRNDRDYLYGRLLGAADKLEEYALRKKDNERDVTAAIRYMQTFAQCPFRTWKTIHECLNPYIQSVKGSFAFNEIQSIMQLFKSGDYENDTPLKGSYLIGYYHERAEIDRLAKDAKEKRQSAENTKEENTQ